MGSGQSAAAPATAGVRQLAGGHWIEALPKVNGAWDGGQLVTGTLFSALLVGDGRVHRSVPASPAVAQVRQ